MTAKDIVLDISTIPHEVPQFYSYRSGRKDVNFFVIRLQDRILSFLDACLTCYPRKLGYRHDNGFVTCRACDTRYSIYKLEKGLGGCYPIQFEGRHEKGKFLISRATLDRHAGKF
jgi:uncharacterized membrane protein